MLKLLTHGFPDHGSPDRGTLQWHGEDPRPLPAEPRCKYPIDVLGNHHLESYFELLSLSFIPILESRSGVTSFPEQPLQTPDLVGHRMRPQLPHS